MGCFDFTYADNGENVRGRRGYLYLTDSLAEAIRVPNPLRFTRNDEYGVFTFQIVGEDVDLDIYALLCLMLYIDMPDLLSVYCSDGETEYHCDRMLEQIRKRDYTNPDLKLEQHIIRIPAISYTYDKKFLHEYVPAVTRQVKPLGNQKEKYVSCSELMTHPIPLLITRKKLNLSGTLQEIARQWGFVSGNDPNQGFNRTENVYYPYPLTWE